MAKDLSSIINFLKSEFGDGSILSTFDLKNSGATQNDINNLIRTKHLNKIKRGCFEFIYRPKT